MMMKYKDLGKALSKEEMKNVTGGYNLPPGCVAICRVHLSAGSAYYIAVNVASCNENPLITCGMHEFISCSCTNPF